MCDAGVPIPVVFFIFAIVKNLHAATGPSVKKSSNRDFSNHKDEIENIVRVTNVTLRRDDTSFFNPAFEVAVEFSKKEELDDMLDKAIEEGTEHSWISNNIFEFVNHENKTVRIPKREIGILFLAVEGGEENEVAKVNPWLKYVAATNKDWIFAGRIPMVLTHVPEKGASPLMHAGCSISGADNRWHRWGCGDSKITNSVT